MVMFHRFFVCLPGKSSFSSFFPIIFLGFPSFSGEYPPAFPALPLFAYQRLFLPHPVAGEARGLEVLQGGLQR